MPPKTFTAGKRCTTCEKLDNRKSGLCCSRCADYHHAKCLDMTDQQFKGFTTRGDWVCRKCKLQVLYSPIQIRNPMPCNVCKQQHPKRLSNKCLVCQKVYHRKCILYTTKFSELDSPSWICASCKTDKSGNSLSRSQSVVDVAVEITTPSQPTPNKFYTRTIPTPEPLMKSKPQPEVQSAASELRIYHLNICGLRHKVREVEKLVKEFRIDVLWLSESLLKHDQTFNLNIPGYEYGRFDRVRQGGGLVCYVRTGIDFDFVRIPNLEEEIESQAVHLKLSSNSSLLVTCVYRPPKPNIPDFFKQIEKVFQVMKTHGQEHVLLGDFNLHGIHRERLVQIAETKLALVQLIKHPTRASTHTANPSFLDLLFYNQTKLCAYYGVVGIGTKLSDHSCIFLVRKQPEAGRLAIKPERKNPSTFKKEKQADLLY